MRLLMVCGGAALVAFGVFLEITWLAVCFGSVILGIVLLIFAPHILFFPFAFFALPGAAFIMAGINGRNMKSRGKKPRDIIDVEVVD